eukprot:PhM_4_TR1264/c0_g1_i2/m.31747
MGSAASSLLQRQHQTLFSLSVYVDDENDLFVSSHFCRTDLQRITYAQINIRSNTTTVLEGDVGEIQNVQAFDEMSVAHLNASSASHNSFYQLLNTVKNNNGYVSKRETLKVTYLEPSATFCKTLFSPHQQQEEEQLQPNSYHQ